MADLNMAVTAPATTAKRRIIPLEIYIGGALLIIMGALAIFAPLIAPYDPQSINPSSRLAPASAEHWLGTDRMGRDIFTRVIYGSRSSLIVGLAVAALAIGIGLIIGLVAGFIRSLDGLIMRIMDGLMAIPAILLAITIIALIGPSVWNLVIVLAIPDIPRVVRVVRSVVLSVREEPYVEAARTLGTPTIPMMVRHILPNTIAPLIVLTSYICAGAVLAEAALSFLGVGLPPEVPSWGNMISEGRVVFQLSPMIVFIPGILLSVTVLGINLVGDGLRDLLDPKRSHFALGGKKA
jgi:peptide/nickel transport system permease protein